MARKRNRKQQPATVGYTTAQSLEYDARLMSQAHAGTTASAWAAYYHGGYQGARPVAYRGDGVTPRMGECADSGIVYPSEQGARAA